ncbi:hypothetical protein Cgig2_005292 [Carnegiea gigantea]|uniref:SWIM-type domain-containing protein n=1 Tax=Carnegiea gigantea TaxID=171969 RepID=A0A9Q1JMP1_9CARY|nr:hypothetical protein Cgig2_005292 [Carnegiea gigantea]
MMFDTVEDCLEFYKRYIVYVAFSLRSSPTTKNEAGKSWKRYMCSKEGFCQPAKMPEIAIVIAEVMPQARNGPQGGKLGRKWPEAREVCEAHILLRSTDDGKFEIIKFHEGHVHPLYTPSRRKFLTSNRNVSFISKHMGITNVEANQTYQIKHNYENEMRIGYVVYNERTSECRCSFLFFDSDRIPCAHILLIFISNSLREISATYMINRRTKMIAKAPMYEFDSVVGDAYGEVATQNKLIANVWSQFYKCMDLAGCTSAKRQLFLSAMTSIEHQLQNMGGESTSNEVANLQA